MAYSNWGAFVYKDGARRKDREDVGVFDDDEKDVPSDLRIFANIIKGREKYGSDPSAQPWFEHSHHAVLGDGPVRLAGYKCKPELYHADDDGTVRSIGFDQFETVLGDYGIVESCRGWFDGCTFEVLLDVDTDNHIDLKLAEADGAQWTARCGYLYGAGHMDDADD